MTEEWKGPPLGGAAATVREFKTGATRDVDTSKPDYEGFLSPLVIEAFGEYMNFNRQMRDGSVRESDNWQKGMPLDVYMKSGFRHFMDWWLEHRGHETDEGQVWALLALMFNAQGYLHERLKADPRLLDRVVQRAEDRRAQSRATSNDNVSPFKVQNGSKGDWRP